MKIQKFKQTEIGKIPEDWEIKPFDGNLSIKGRIGWRGYTREDLVKKGPLVIGGLEIKSRRYLDLSQAKHLREEKYEESPEIKLKDKDILLVTRGNLGEVGFFDSALGKATINPSIVILSNFKENPLFLFYYLISPQGNNLVMNLRSGSSVPAIYQSAVKTLIYPSPTLPEQLAIASILSSLDAKIELNNKMNKTLEAIGQAIFKKWFVEEKKEGWGTSTIGKELKTILGGTPDRTKPEYWKGDINWINSGAINDFPIISSSEKITEVGLKNSATQLMPEKTIVLPFVVSFGKVVTISILGIETAGNQSVLGIIPNEKFSSSFIYYYIQNQKNEIYSSVTGGAQQHINKRNVDETEIIIPDEETLEKFNLVVEPLVDLILKNAIQSQTLSQIRDALLPKLMSGKIRVKC